MGMWDWAKNIWPGSGSQPAYGYDSVSPVNMAALQGTPNYFTDMSNWGSPATSAPFSLTSAPAAMGTPSFASNISNNMSSWYGGSQASPTFDLRTGSYAGGSAPTSAVGGAGTGTGAETPWFKNAGNWGTILQGIGSLASAYMNFKNYGLAKQQLGLARDSFNANLNNQIKSYNTSLEDRINGRTSAYAGKEKDVQAYLAAHQLRR